MDLFTEADGDYPDDDERVRLTDEGFKHTIRSLRATQGFGFDYDLVLGHKPSEESAREIERIAHFMNEQKLYDDIIDFNEDVEGTPFKEFSAMISLTLVGGLFQMLTEDEGISITEYVESLSDEEWLDLELIVEDADEED